MSSLVVGLVQLGRVQHRMCGGLGGGLAGLGYSILEACLATQKYSLQCLRVSLL